MHTVICPLDDYPDWHKGREHYGVWLFEVDAPQVLQRLSKARQLLADVLHPPGARQAHITVFVNGFASERLRYDDDFSAEQLCAQVRAVQALGLRPFTLTIGSAQSFTSAAYLAVDLPESLLRLRQALAQAVTEVRQSAYIPHITAGLYAKQVPMLKITERLCTLEDTPLCLTIRAVCFATYHAQEMQGLLSVQRRIEFA